MTLKSLSACPIVRGQADKTSNPRGRLFWQDGRIRGHAVRPATDPSTACEQTRLHGFAVGRRFVLAKRWTRLSGFCAQQRLGPDHAGSRLYRRIECRPLWRLDPNPRHGWIQCASTQSACGRHCHACATTAETPDDPIRRRAGACVLPADDQGSVNISQHGWNTWTFVALARTKIASVYPTKHRRWRACWILVATQLVPA